MSKDITRGEIKMEGDERIASLCPLLGVPNVYIAMTTRAAMWRVTLTTYHGKDDYWEAKFIPSKADKNAPIENNS